MHHATKHDLQSDALTTVNDGNFSNELSILRDLLHLLPAGVTVQDEHGEFILMNEAAATQLQLAASG